MQTLDEQKDQDSDIVDCEQSEEEICDIDPQPTTSSLKPDDPPKKKKRGIIYLSTIPKHMTVSIAREMFSQYADVVRMFFQPSTKSNDGKSTLLYGLFLFKKCVHSFQTNRVTRKRRNDDRRSSSPKAGLNSKVNGLLNTLLHGSTINRLRRERVQNSMTFCGA